MSDVCLFEGFLSWQAVRLRQGDVLFRHVLVERPLLGQQGAGGTITSVLKREQKWPVSLREAGLSSHPTQLHPCHTQPHIVLR